MCSLVSGTPFDARARCPTWEGFLDFVMDHDQDMIAYLQTAIGYTLTGLARRHEMYFLYGTGSNGKSSFIETFVGILGDYYAKIDIGLILTTGWQGAGDNNTLAQKAQLAGKRMVSSTEIPGGRAFNDGVIKDLASDEAIQACHKYGHPFFFKQTHKLWVFGNSRPIVKVTDQGFWRRLVPIPFSVTIPDDLKDENLLDKLKAEWPGILNWALQGLRNNYRTVPKRIREEQAQYRSDSDLLAEFLETEAKASPEREDWVVDQTELYKRYVMWCETNGDKEVRRNTFYHQLIERRFSRGKIKNSRVFYGIRLLTPEERREREIKPSDPYNPQLFKDSYKNIPIETTDDPFPD
jgi:putative DNA primase/helicase